MIFDMKSIESKLWIVLKKVKNCVSQHIKYMEYISNTLHIFCRQRKKQLKLNFRATQLFLKNYRKANVA